MSGSAIKKLVSFIVITVFSVVLFGCDSLPKHKIDTQTDNGISILCSAYPQYDWVRNITEGADGVEVSLLLENGEEMHSFQPSADDIIRIKQSDIFIYNGGSSDRAIDDILSQNRTDGQIVINMMHAISDKLLCTDETEGHHHEPTAEAEHSDCYEADEHIWLSIKNAISVCEKIGEEIIKADPENSEIYNKNLKEYTDALYKLDREYTDVVSGAKRNEMVIADRFPFIYLAEDYGIVCHSAFPGCSGETDASFSTILYLADKLKSLGTEKMIVIEKSSMSVEGAVREAMQSESAQTYVMNSVQSVTDEDIKAGFSYITAMRENLAVIEEVLND